MSLEIVNIIGLAAGAATSVLAVLVKTFAERRFRHVEFTFANEAVPAPSTDPLTPAVERLDDVRSALTRQQSIASTNRWTSGLLTVGQYIIGGLLASSFVQQSLSREVVGALGLLVLISSLIYQHFRPDIQLRGAMGRSLRLRALIRQAEDDLYAMRSEPANAPSIADFRRRLSTALSDIEASELQDVSTRTGEDTNNTK